MGLERYLLIYSNALWQCFSNLNFLSFLVKATNGWHQPKKLDIKCFKYATWPWIEHNRVRLFKGRISMITLNFFGSIAILYWCTTNAKNFLEMTPKVHFMGFSLRLYHHNHSKTMCISYNWSSMTWLLTIKILT